MARINSLFRREPREQATRVQGRLFTMTQLAPLRSFHGDYEGVLLDTRRKRFYWTNAGDDVGQIMRDNGLLFGGVRYETVNAMQARQENGLSLEATMRDNGWVDGPEENT